MDCLIKLYKNLDLVIKFNMISSYYCINLDFRNITAY
jgi:hypothetical protein